MTMVGGPITTSGGSGDSSPVSALTFTPDGRLLLSGDTDSAVTPWQVWRYSDPYSALKDLVG